MNHSESLPYESHIRLKCRKRQGLPSYPEKEHTQNVPLKRREVVGAVKPVEFI